ncbi:isoleucine--tRNA ligase [Candidatus Gracilibacteria bacterium]|nr:isoleucine--tRNA ligase [Candidatus Gracilibacteria bacterium]
MKFSKVNQKQSFPALEEEVLKFWKENKIFEKSVEQRPADKPYRFYDGPPFITGTPHYGSLLSSIIKDIVPRYHTMQGKRVERKWGWDCHGLPIEEKVQKKLGLAGSKDIEEKVGIKKFIEECYTYTKETSAEWDWYIDHIGRWVDMENCYKTMDQDYMESVIWVFKKIWEKGLIYKGQRVSLYSWKLSTPISNFEVAMDDSYEEVSDPAVTVMFPLTESSKHVQEGDYVLAWTTTPWTIPAHMSMALNPELAYSRVLSEGSYYIVATARVEHVFKGREYEIVESFMGSDLIGLRYEAPFPYYQGSVDAEKNHCILAADFITDTDGTGIGHQAPEFGDVDFQLAKKNGVHISAALDNEGKYTSEIVDYEGMHYQEANDVISAKLKEMGRLFKKESINHRVAMCPRSGTPLIYKAQDSWFIDIQSLKDGLIAENEGINWQPNHLKHGQFLKSMEGAPDWCISRTRYWGTPMPIWIGQDSEGNQVDMKVFGSKAEIEEASGMKVTDFHRPYIDDIMWKEGDITYTRLPEVLDVWMDSGSMPYAQEHYPFENSEKMEASYPADFIVEYIGQVRAWFYVMHVCGVALFDQRSFTNVITTGIVNGSDGRKMSKSYGNYPDPKGTIQKYGADALRFYMANSPLLTGGNMDFKEEGILEVIKKVILPLWNTYSFFTTYANIDGFEKPHLNSSPTGEDEAVARPLSSQERVRVRLNPLDTWILSETHKLVDDVVKGMEKYEVTEATRPIVKFMDNLTNWYIRRSRKRFWKSENDGDKMQAYETLYEVLVTLCKVMAPFTPFVTEHIYKNLTGEESLHLADFPVADLSLVDIELNADMDLVQKIINLGLSLRTRAKIRVRQPLQSISIGTKIDEYYKNIITEELNIKEVLEVDSSSIAQKICKPNGRLIGPKFGGAVKEIISQAKAGNFEEIDENTVKVGEYTLEGDEFEIAFMTQGEADNIESGFGMVIAMHLEITPELEIEGYARDLVRFIQEARKEAGYNVEDRISVNIKTENLEAILASYDICSETLSVLDSGLENGDLVKEVVLGEGKQAKIILKK